MPPLLLPPMPTTPLLPLLPPTPPPLPPTPPLLLLVAPLPPVLLPPQPAGQTDVASAPATTTNECCQSLPAIDRPCGQKR